MTPGVLTLRKINVTGVVVAWLTTTTSGLPSAVIIEVLNANAVRGGTCKSKPGSPLFESPAFMDAVQCPTAR